MNASQLLGGSAAPTGASSRPSSASGTSRGDSPAQGRFDRHLKQDTATDRANSPSAASNRRAANAKADNASNTPSAAGDHREPPGTTTDSRAETPATAADALRPTDPAAAAADAAETTPDVWPPPGLAGLALSTTPVPGVVSPALAAEDPASATLPALTASAPAPASAVTALPTLGATTAALAGVAVPVDAPVDPDLLPEALAMAGTLEGMTDDSADAPDPVASLLQPGALLPAARSAADAALRIAEPTPTPVVGQDGFDDAISARIGWLADQKIGHAHIRVSPDDMGTIDVRLQMDGDRIHATFSSPHVDVRQALESSLPRLRELLGEQGFQLAHADVGQQHNGQEAKGGRSAGGRGDGASGEAEGARVETTLTAAQLVRQRGLLDTYA